MPATRATGMATPAISSPNNNCPTIEGMIGSASPVWPQRLQQKSVPFSWGSDFEKAAGRRDRH
jgi:hypothetical protein